MRKALTIAWLLLSACATALLLVPFIVAPDTLLQVSVLGRLPGEHDHAGCPVCGMTRAFVLIAGGQWSQASALNSGAVPLYVTLLANSVVAAWLIVSRSVKGLVGRRPRADDYISTVEATKETLPCKC